MALSAIEAPKDVLTTNQWILEISGVPRATFVQISGVTRRIDGIPRADGGTGIVYTFPNQRVDYGALQFVRMYDPLDQNDLNTETFLTNVIASGTKLNGELIKYHFGKPLFRIQFTGMLFLSETYPQLRKDTSGPFEVQLEAKLDFWEKLPA